MENQKDNILMKVRSSRACIAAGYRLYTGNFKKIFRLTWLAAIVYGLFNGIYTSYIASEYPKMFLAMSSGQMFMTDNIIPATVTILMPIVIILSSIWLYSHVFSMLHQHRSEGIITTPIKLLKISINKQSILRTTAWILISILISVIMAAITSGILYYAISIKSTTMMAAAPLAGLIILLLLIPLVHPAMHYLTTRDTKLMGILGTDYSTGMRYWGKIFTVTFITIIFSSIILSITTLPAIILSVANIKAQTGVMMGDPLGMPDYIGKLTLLVFSLAGFIQAYVMLSIFFPAYYVSGSIEKQEQERNEKKNLIY